VHGRLRRRELGEALAAAAAGRADLDLLGDDRGGGDLVLAGGHERADRRRLGALALGVGGVLDVRPGVDRPARRAQRSADLEARVGRVRVAHRPLGGPQQQLRRLEQEVGVALRD
jgi:hypothetical protein